jgi:hypothetical protein
MNYYDLVQWQKLDPSNGLVYPWFTHNMLKAMENWPMKDWRVLEYGAGKSTPWWRKKAQYVASVDHDAKWANSVALWCAGFGLSNGRITLVAGATDDINNEAAVGYINATGDDPFDCVVVDGLVRYECMVKACAILGARPEGGILIVDNWDQDGFLCPACVELLAPYEGHIFPQLDHTDHHGNCWKTAYFVIPSACDGSSL